MHRELTDSFFLYIVTHTARLGTIIDVLLLTTRHTSFEQETIFLFVLIFFIVGGIGLITMQLTGKTEDTYVKRQSALSSLKDNEKK